ncbi:MAG: DUF1080 domain-containing protein [Bryobacteraceae bacterium]
MTIKNGIFPCIAAAILAGGALRAASGPDSAWTPLFNGRNFDGWYTYLPSTGKNNDPKKVFKVEDGMIHILDIPETDEKQEFGYLSTERELSNCRIRVEFKWGTKRFVPNNENKRDSGLLYFFKMGRKSLRRSKPTRFPCMSCQGRCERKAAAASSSPATSRTAMAGTNWNWFWMGIRAPNS